MRPTLLIAMLRMPLQLSPLDKGMFALTSSYEINSSKFDFDLAIFLRTIAVDNNKDTNDTSDALGRIMHRRCVTNGNVLANLAADPYTYFFHLGDR
mmetsp:Transcript_37106/g.55271  ORF Transcript_37106/g.55271 Transcript_37106/m.55271 type:complete len:96 (+) Transcript_37106:240-527(+)